MALSVSYLMWFMKEMGNGRFSGADFYNLVSLLDGEYDETTENEEEIKEESKSAK